MQLHSKLSQITHIDLEDTPTEISAFFFIMTHMVASQKRLCALLCDYAIGLQIQQKRS